MDPLIQYSHNHNSQVGQDGILQEIFHRIGIDKGYAVEFGAWDGVHLSNSRLLLDNGWSGVQIEGNATRYKDLAKLYEERDDVHTIHANTDISGDNSLDNILTRCGAPEDLDFISIDVDGNDWHIWNSLQHFKPKVVCIETAVAIPYFIEFVPKPDTTTHPLGSSPLSIYKLALSKGYRGACYCNHDWIFVREELHPMLKLKDSSYWQLYIEGVEFNTMIYRGMSMKEYIRDRLIPFFQENAQTFDCAVDPRDIREL